MGLFGSKPKLEEKVSEVNKSIDESKEKKPEEPLVEEEYVFKKIKIEEQLPDLESSAKKLWNLLNRKGKVKKVKGKIGDVPTLVNSEEGTIYPISASFLVNIAGAEYKFDIDSNYDKERLNVSVELGYENREVVKEIFSEAKSEIVSISKHYEDKEALINLYNYIVENASSTKMLPPSSLKKLPQMELNSDGKLVPKEAIIRATINEDEYTFEFEGGFITEKVSVSCPRNKIEFINTLLNKMQTGSVDENDDSKKVKSLDFIVSVSQYSWNDVGGLDEIKKELEQYIKWPLENPELLIAVNTTTPSGVLLIGPPGNGKTTIAKIIANESGAVFYSISPKDINSMWVGGTEKNWGRLFNQARKDVKDGKKVIIFIDEVDGFFTSREEMDKYSRISFGQLCQEWQGISDLQGILIMGATNRYQDLDEALVRPGRFSKKVYIGNPNEKARVQILNLYFKKMPLSEDVSAQILAQRTEGYSGSHLRDLCEGSSFTAVERYSKEKGIEIKDIKGELIKEVKINLEDFLNTLKIQDKYKEQKKEENKIGFHQ